MASKIEDVVKTWTHAMSGAVERLTKGIEEGRRFDARDREALAYLLTCIDGGRMACGRCGAGSTCFNCGR